MNIHPDIANIDWLTGFVEGEGNFDAVRIKSKQHGKDYKGQCRIRIGNLELDLIQHCKRILASKMILSNIYTSTYTGRSSYELCIYGYQDCNMFYHLTKDSLQCRHNQLETILNLAVTERTITPNLNWLIGFLEAEGSFTIKTIHSERGITHHPIISVENTNLLTIIKIRRTLNELEIQYDLVDRSFDNEKWKSTQIVSIIGARKLIKFLRMTKDLWKGAKTIGKIELLTEYCESRIKFISKTDGYSNREHEIANNIKGKGTSSIVPKEI